MEDQSKNKKPLTKIEQRIKRDKDKIIEFLAEHANVSLACKRAGVSRETFYRWKESDEEFDTEVQVAILAGKRSLNDLAQSHLVRKIQNDDIKGITFHLEHCHPDYNGKSNAPNSDLLGPVTVITITPYNVEKKYGPDRSLYESDIPKERPDLSNIGEV